MHEPETKPSLILKLADPARENAWTEFVTLYQPVIYRVARARGLQHVDSEDLTQDVLAKVQNRISSFDISGKGSFRGWLRKITRDLIVDRFRKHPLAVGSGDTAVFNMLGQHPQASDPVTHLEIEVRRERLIVVCRRVRPEFSEAVWDAFWKTAIDGESIPQVAKAQGKSEGAIRVARCRVMARIKKEVAKDDCKTSL